LNPLTKAVVAAVTTLATLALGGYLAPAILFAAVVVPGTMAGRVSRRVLVASRRSRSRSRRARLVFTRAGTTVLFRLGPSTPPRGR
jgi:hypothetical protein